MVNTKKVCDSCGPVETRYDNCPRCWGPVRKRTERNDDDTYRPQVIPPPPSPPVDTTVLERLIDRVAEQVRDARISDDDRTRLIDKFVKNCKK